ncbi:MAG: peptidase M18 [Acidobacteriales bacterium]|nr:peptidase M18 [Terriglobales bacterium]
MLRRLVVLGLITVFTIALFADSEGSVWATKKSSWLLLKTGQREQVFQFADDYKAYMRVAKTALASTTEVTRLAKAAGFTEFTAPGQVRPGARLIFPARQRAIVLVVIGSEPLVSGSRVIGTHHDSPHIDLKARPLYKAGNSGIALFKTVYYGGIKKYQWSNLPLAVMGKIDTPDGRSINVSIGNNPNEPVFVIPDNAPHSDKELRDRKYTEVLKGEELDPVAGSIPDANSSVVAQVAQQLAMRYKIREEDLVSAELQLVPAAMPADVGLDSGLVGAFGQDDKLSSYCAVRAMLDLKGTPRHTAMAYLSNYEEEDSVNNTGAASQLLNSVFAELLAAQRGSAYSDLDLRRALRNSEVISADVNDGINPLFPETSEQTNAARLGYGVTIKRYGHGFDANSEFVARIRGLLERNEIPWQTQTPKVDVGTGATIGTFMSAQDMEVIDMGVPLLSLHAPFEMSSKVDVWNFYRFMGVFFGS